MRCSYMICLYDVEKKEKEEDERKRWVFKQTDIHSSFLFSMPMNDRILWTKQVRVSKSA